MKTASIMGVPVPLDLFSSAKGKAVVTGDLVTVESLGFQGEGLYARLSGTVKGNKTTMQLEILPERGAEKQFPMILLLKQYEKSPGRYVIPLRQ